MLVQYGQREFDLASVPHVGLRDTWGPVNGRSDSEDAAMPFLALAIALLLAGPVYGGDCSGAAPNDLCEAGRPAPTSSGLTSSGLTSSGKSADRTTGPTRRSKPSRSPKVHSAIAAVASAIEVRRATESTPAGFKKLSTKLARVNDAGEIHVYVVLTEWSPEHVAALEALGLRVEATVPTRRLIQGWVPATPSTTSPPWTRSRR